MKRPLNRGKNEAGEWRSLPGLCRTEPCSHTKPGDLVICDNFSSHKVRGVREAIEACGAGLLYLPPYSPDLNPIEMAFAKIKAILRKASARTWKDLLSALQEAIESFTTEHCANFFAHANYAAN